MHKLNCNYAANRDALPTFADDFPVFARYNPLKCLISPPNAAYCAPVFVYRKNFSPPSICSDKRRKIPKASKFAIIFPSKSVPTRHLQALSSAPKRLSAAKSRYKFPSGASRKIRDSAIIL